jgi:hypothetical protein
VNVIDMKEARERLQRRREDERLEHRREENANQGVQRRIDLEIAEARAQGRGWTAYRPFFSKMEAAGAMICGECWSRGRTRGTARRAKYVSYSTQIRGCTTKCEWCYEGIGEIADGLTMRMQEVLGYAYDDAGNEYGAPKATRAALQRRGLVQGTKLTSDGLKARKLIQEEAQRRRPA